MTARVCPVHGEYAPTGICRWCEPAPAKYSRAACDDVKIYAQMLGPPPKPLPDESAVAKAVREYYATRRGLRAPISWRIEYEDPARVASRDVAEESRLLAQHAALRWERVARRWGAKHRPWTSLEIAVECDRFMDKLIAGYIPKRWP